MKLLYRLHLLDFDPKDEKQWLVHWDFIQKAIATSSNSLSLKLRGKKPADLSAQLKLKIYKYLLRGRYRCTPFGYWAGVGLASWQKETFPLIADLDYTIISELTPSIPDNQAEDEKRYRLAPGLIGEGNFFHYWSYCKIEEGWRRSSISNIKMVDDLVNHLVTAKSINQAEFLGLFSDINPNTAISIWNSFLESGLLLDARFPSIGPNTETKVAPSIDLKISNSIHVSQSIQNQLDQFIAQAGALFSPVSSPFIQELKKWFLFHYDDRFVPLALMEQLTEIPKIFKTSSATSDSINSALKESFWGNVKKIDLKELFELKPTQSLEHIHLVFKVGGKNKVYIENIASNRPFAYSGRFSLDEEIFDNLRDNFPKEDEQNHVIYADVLLFESQKSNLICRHKNPYFYVINPFIKETKNRVLGMADLCLGLRDDEFILISKSLRKRIIPTIQHPLNPTHISYFPSRLIWEIAHQQQFKFLPYVHPAFQEGNYLPALFWGDIQVQDRRWKLQISQFDSEEKLWKHLQHDRIPPEVLVGYLDRELLLNWEDPRDLKLLWEELKIHEELFIYACSWKNDSGFRKENGSKMYPQFIYSKLLKSTTYPDAKPYFIHLVSTQDPNWLSIRILMEDEAIPIFLDRSLPHIMEELNDLFFLESWYFLVYKSPMAELRLRVKCSQPNLNKPLFSKLEQLIKNSAWVKHILKADYYPEVGKYGSKGIVQSELIFSFESKLVLGFLPDKTNFWSELDPVSHTEWVVQLYYLVITASPKAKEMFSFIRDLVKDIPYQERRKLKELADFRVELEISQSIKDAYLAMFRNHEYFDSEKSILFVFNHLHMCCNRIFGLDAPHHEQVVIYKLYQRLGNDHYSTS
ncbi:thiopeptide-type bacteriocin biosynthesis domain-containing protein [Algoriphagus faecimaris]|uniref:Thiopeptide-type bacteriocin biosynthesis domain-containing protein n=1 Tax=Algoriphagus faecimaris TaxID=686796 RepID=A0A1G6Y1R9_9BACT|nr:thiopeptide-type bacteriocin biosynthesis protein [Algoriphagus faecimaris]SDD83873.1 thiopeptide-type bacteriocin biosynthesis domain-containing protein [Algoriphagus faecimaris]